MWMESVSAPVLSKWRNLVPLNKWDMKELLRPQNCHCKEQKKNYSNSERTTINKVGKEWKLFCKQVRKKLYAANYFQNSINSDLI